MLTDEYLKRFCQFYRETDPINFYFKCEWDHRGLTQDIRGHISRSLSKKMRDELSEIAPQLATNFIASLKLHGNSQ